MVQKKKKDIEAERLELDVSETNERIEETKASLDSLIAQTK